MVVRREILTDKDLSKEVHNNNGIESGYFFLEYSDSLFAQSKESAEGSIPLIFHHVGVGADNSPLPGQHAQKNIHAEKKSCCLSVPSFVFLCSRPISRLSCGLIPSIVMGCEILGVGS